MYLQNSEKFQSKSNGKSLKFKAIFLVILILIGYGVIKIFSIGKNVSLENIQENNQTNQENEKKNPDDTSINYKISEGDIPAEVFSSQGKFNNNDVEALLASAKNVYDLSKIKVGQTLRFYFNGEEKAIRMEYDYDTEKVIVVERNGNDFKCREEKISYEVSNEIVKGKIENFFYVDAQSAGLSEPTVLEMGDIFSFDIDFMTEIQVEDEFSVIYEKRMRNGEKAHDGKILAAKFINNGNTYYAYYFEDEGEGNYYDAEGHVLERQFLKAPLSYRRISSGFTGARFHPITKTVTAHYQIDYAASTGTPVISTAYGTSSSAGWEGGRGTIVRIRHDNGYTTHYGHLSGFAKGIRSGINVSRGQLVGFVGSTGWSTGPHLDYGLKLNGSPINPLSLKLPKGNPLNSEKMARFEEVKKKYTEQLN